MLGSSIVEAGIGLMLVYLLLSLVASALQESLEAKLKIRASNLERGLRELLQDPDGDQVTKTLYKHPLIYGLFQGDYKPGSVRSGLTTNLPTYIPSGCFAAALMDIVVNGHIDEKGTAQGARVTVTADGVRKALESSSNNSVPFSVKRLLLLALDSAHNDLPKAQSNVEAWFNSGMDRVSGWYKRRTQVVLMGLGLVIAVSLNVDSTQIGKELYHNHTLRVAAVAQAEAVVKSGQMPVAPMAEIKKLQLPIGWPDKDYEWYFPADHILGWLITAFAISFGANFWFDLLNKFMVIRSTVKPHEKSPEESSEDRQRPEKRVQVWQAFSTPASSAQVTPAPEQPAQGLGHALGPNYEPHEWANRADPHGGVI